MLNEQQNNYSDQEFIVRPRAHFIDPITGQMFALTPEQVKSLEDALTKTNQELEETEGYYVTLKDLYAILCKTKK